MVLKFLKKKKHLKIEDYYEIGKQIGKGAFSIVREAASKKTGELVAVKSISKNYVNQNDLKRLTSEIDIMRRLKHEYIIQLLEVFESEEEIHLVMELIDGGELFDRIVDKGQHSESDAQDLIYQIMTAVQYMHEHGVVHRDLKPENLLCCERDGRISIRIADFGLSKLFIGEEELKTACGTPDYVAPEILKCQSYTPSVDIWSLGVITYILLCGFTPFYAETHHELFEKILALDYDFPDPEWSEVSDEAKDFIKKLLFIEPEERYTAEQCLQHPWLKDQKKLSLQRKFTRLDSTLDLLKEYNRTRKMPSESF